MTTITAGPRSGFLTSEWWTNGIGMTIIGLLAKYSGLPADILTPLIISISAICLWYTHSRTALKVKTANGTGTGATP